jgi:putative membrane protein
MYRNARSRLTFAAGLLAAGMYSACGGERADTPETAGSASIGDTAAVATDTMPAPEAGPDLSDANVFALLDHANQADSAAGAVAAKKATNADVKQYARMMMADHHKLRQQGADLAKKLNVTPQPPPDDPVTALAQQEMAALESAPKGMDFDRTYIHEEIKAHQAVLDLAEQAHQAAGNAELRTMIEQARPLLETHLKQAQEIEEKLGGTA